MKTGKQAREEWEQKKIAIIDDILSERDAQEKQWGEKNDDKHTALTWAALRGKFEQRHIRAAGVLKREFLIKLAALCVAEIESIDRKVARGEEA